MSVKGYPRTLVWADFFQWKDKPVWVQSQEEEAFTTTKIEPPTQWSAQAQAAGKQSPAGKQFQLAPFDIGVKVEQGGSNTWVIQGKQTNELLEHEQGHLDITGLVAHEMHAALEALRDSSEGTLTKKANETVKRLGAKNAKLQEKYDTETHNGTNAIKQAQWNKHFRDSKATIGKKFKALPNP